jgi:DNA-binding beta-propeller fold protein YncE
MPSLAFYGDTEGNEVFAIDISLMSLVARIPTGLGPYPVDIVNSTHVLASTRKEESVTPIDITTLTALPKILLSHKPRSAAAHSNGLVLVAGADKPVVTIIDSKTWTVIGGPYGVQLGGLVEDFGGPLASGHPKWLPDGKRFFHLDRLNRRISLYDCKTGKILWGINTATSCHDLTIDPNSGIYYGMCEGNSLAKIPSSIIKLIPKDNIFDIDNHVFLDVDYMNSNYGSHHIDLNEDRLYCGSNEGYIYVFDKNNLKPITKIKSGSGSGHVGFVTINNKIFGISIDHEDQFVTVFDAKKDVVIRKIKVSDSITFSKKKTQGHTFSKKGNLFYMMAGLDSNFLEINIETGNITRSVQIPAKDSTSPKPFPLQGTFIWDS